MDINNKFVLPDYNNCLVNLANSILKKYGVKTTADTLKLADKYLEKDYKNVVVFLLDAMGISIIEKHLKEDGFLRKHLLGEFDSVYPPTTVAATTSMLSGLYPNEHGWFGWDVYYPQIDKNVVAFLNKEQHLEKKDAKPEKVLEDGTKIWSEDSLEEQKNVADYSVAFTYTPYENIVDKINKNGKKAYFSMPFIPPYPEDVDAIINRIEELCREPEEKFIYAYWNEPDNTMHRMGTESKEAKEMVLELEKKVEELAANVEDTLLIITADHSHVDCVNYCILDYSDILECLERMPSFEPRTLNLFIKDEYKEAFPDIFNKYWKDDFILLSREEVMDKKVFGTGENLPEFEKMIGDYVAFAYSPASLFNTHIEAQLMPGGHAGMTEEEYKIPLIVVEI